jgi:hypothetical protein
MTQVVYVAIEKSYTLFKKSVISLKGFEVSTTMKQLFVVF